MLSIHLRLSLRSGLFPSGFPEEGYGTKRVCFAGDNRMCGEKGTLSAM
jgi:hypothetical protein